jgi:hypothetical protein
MGKLNNGITGGFSGTVGPAVGASWKGIPVIRSRPPRKRGKSSEAQLRQMSKLQLMTSFISPIKDLLNNTYTCVTVQMSCFNKALSYNMRNAITGEYPEFRINFPRVALGIGDLLNPEMHAAISDAAGQVTFNWTDNSGEGSARASDHCFIAVYCEQKGQWRTRSVGSQRNAGSYTFNITEFSGLAVQTYIGFLSADAHFVSTSLYTGQVTIL